MGLEKLTPRGSINRLGGELKTSVNNLRAPLGINWKREGPVGGIMDATTKSIGRLLYEGGRLPVSYISGLTWDAVRMVMGGAWKFTKGAAKAAFNNIPIVPLPDAKPDRRL